MTPLPQAERYQRFREFVFSGLEEATTGRDLPGLATAMPELELQSLWFSGAFGRDFISTDGQPVRVIDFGEWNSGPGPDFTHCTIDVAGQTLRGTVELDPDVRDWERHGHGANPDYRQVVLHVFLQSPDERFFTRTAAHQQVAQVRLAMSMLEADAKPSLQLAAARLGRCAAPLRDMEDARVRSILEAAAQHRLEKKTRRLHRAIAAHGRGQAVFQALAQALGYRRNQQPFLLLSQRLPLARLKKLPPEAREALLFGVSGFLESVRYEDTLPETRSYLRQLWEQWWQLRDGCARWLAPDQQPRWSLAATRPGNHPHRRLGALAAMLTAWETVSAPLLDAGRWSQAAWRETLLSLEHPFWSRHYTLLAEPARRPIALIGATRVHEMLANVAYPLLMPERTRLWAEYLELPALLE
ncbi:MAG: DUF2851 family protein, partial [Prosthecobacter sp.]|nr:DUF2851 family protein [Prosthecobacter sp.]